MDAGNDFLPAFVARYNERFSVRAAKSENSHRPLDTPVKKLSDILCRREQRYVGTQLTFHYDRKQIILEQTELSKGLAGNMSNSMTSPIDHSKFAGTDTLFPIASSAKTNE